MPKNETGPVVYLSGYAYRFGADRRMEHIAEGRSRIAGRSWVRVTERTENAERAAAALMMLAGGIGGGPYANLSAAFYLATNQPKENPQ